MIIFVDIDETICFMPPDFKDVKSVGGGPNYFGVTPDRDNIRKINALYKAGNTIIYWTARGTQTGEDWRKVTTEQLAMWGAKYHELRFDKPYYDIMIDDKTMRIEEL